MFKLYLIDYDKSLSNFYNKGLYYFINTNYKKDTKLVDIFEKLKNSKIEKNIKSVESLLNKNDVEYLKKLYPKNYKYYMNIDKNIDVKFDLDEYQENITKKPDNIKGGNINDIDIDFDKELEQLFSTKKGKYTNIIYNKKFKNKKNFINKTNVINYTFVDFSFTYTSLYFKYLITSNTYLDWRYILFLNNKNYTIDLQFLDNIEIKKPYIINVDIFNLIHEKIYLKFSTKNFITQGLDKVLDKPEINILYYPDIKQELMGLNYDSVFYPLLCYEYDIINKIDPYKQIVELKKPDKPYEKDIEIIKGLVLNDTYNINSENYIDINNLFTNYEFDPELELAVKIIKDNNIYIRIKKGMEEWLSYIKETYITSSYINIFIMENGIISILYLYRNGLVKLWVINDGEITKIITKANKIIDKINRMNKTLHFNKQDINICLLDHEKIYMINSIVKYKNVKFNYKMIEVWKKLYNYVLFNKKRTNIISNKLNTFSFNFIKVNKIELEDYISYVNLANNYDVETNILGTLLNFIDNRGILNVELNYNINSYKDLLYLCDLLDKMIYYYEQNQNNFEDKKINFDNYKKIFKLEKLDPVRFRNDKQKDTKFMYSYLCQGDKKQPIILTQEEFQEKPEHEKSEFLKIKNETYKDTYNYYSCENKSNYKYLSFIDKSRNRNNVCMPCCFKKKVNMQVDNKKSKIFKNCLDKTEDEDGDIVKKVNKSYVYKFGKSLEFGEKSNIPDKLQLLLNIKNIFIEKIQEDKNTETFDLYISEDLNIYSDKNISINIIYNILTTNKPIMSIKFAKNLYLIHDNKHIFTYKDEIYKLFLNIIKKLKDKNIFKEETQNYTNYLFSILKPEKYVKIYKLYFVINPKDNTLFPVSKKNIILFKNKLTKVYPNFNFKFIQNLPKQILNRISTVYISNINNKIIAVSFNNNKYTIPCLLNKKEINMINPSLYKTINTDLLNLLELYKHKFSNNTKLDDVKKLCNITKNKYFIQEEKIEEIKLKLINYIKKERNQKIRNIIKADFKNTKKLLEEKKIIYVDFVNILNHYNFYGKSFFENFDKYQFDFDRKFSLSIIKNLNNYNMFKSIFEDYLKKIGENNRSLNDMLIYKLYNNNFELFSILNVNYQKKNINMKINNHLESIVIF